MKKIRINGRCEFPGCVEAEALVSPMPIEGFTNVSAARGYTTERNHPLLRVSYTGKVLCYPSPRGSGGFMQYGAGPLKPAAFVHTEECSLTYAAAMVAHIPSMTGFEQDPMQFIETGDMVLVNADEGYIEITKKDD